MAAALNKSKGYEDCFLCTYISDILSLGPDIVVGIARLAQRLSSLVSSSSWDKRRLARSFSHKIPAVKRGASCYD